MAPTMKTYVRTNVHGKPLHGRPSYTGHGGKQAAAKARTKMNGNKTERIYLKETGVRDRIHVYNMRRVSLPKSKQGPFGQEKISRGRKVGVIYL